ncbi:hypothetical protein FA15DRAFT_548134, partial [Coprinopsis marcescibilis]
HHAAWQTGQVLHRDLSENNLMVNRMEDGTSKGVLNDWDMATRIDSNTQDPGSSPQSRTGTLPFMACELLLNKPPPHFYRHDLESFVYILLW